MHNDSGNLIKKPPICNLVALLAASIVVVIGAGVGYAVLDLSSKKEVVGYAVVLAVLAQFFLASIKVADQWERMMVLRLGKFSRVAGPGIFFVIPIIEQVTHLVDMRVRVVQFSSESTLTKDTVPVNVDAIGFWKVLDAQKSVLEVENYYRAIVLSAQTALRDIIGTHELADMLTHRGQIGDRLKKVLDEKSHPWGITVEAVEVRDILIPKGLEDAMSKQAQAERERQARIILSTAETEIAEKFAKAAEQYVKNPDAMHLRGMNMLYEGLKEKGSMVIVPSSALDTMNLGALSGLISLANMNKEETEKKKK